MAPRILLFQIGFIGDAVVSLPTIRATRRHFGASAELVLLHEQHEHGGSPAAEILSSLGAVDRCLSYSPAISSSGRATAAARLWWTIRRYGFDAVVSLLPGERPPRSVARDRRFFRSAGIRRAIGFVATPDTERYPRTSTGELLPTRHEAATRLARLAADGIDTSEESDLNRPFLVAPEAARIEAQMWLSRARRHSSRPLIAIAPGAKQLTNRWPLERFAEVGRRLLSAHHCELVVIGGTGDRAAAASLVGAWNDGIDATGALSILGTAALLAECRLLVGLDTGTTHLAAAGGVPGVAIYGERDNPGRFDPVGARYRVLRHAVPCAGCRIILDPCPRPDHPCMTGVTVDAVANAVADSLA